MSEPAFQSGDAAAVVRDLGRLAYGEAFALQKSLQQQVVGRRDAAGGPGGTPAAGPGYLLLVEHDPPVITISRRKTARQHLVATAEQLASAGVEVAETDRGGDITYHGPGQLVVYPILDLNMLGLRIHGYLRFLEQVVIDALGRFGIAGRRDEEATGVWVERGSRPAGPQARRHEGVEPRDDVDIAHDTHAQGLQPRGHTSTAKICAMGVRVSRWVSMHGLALNVDPNLDHFDLIVPCGLAGRAVTSMSQLLGDGCPSMDEVKQEMVRSFGRVVRESRRSATTDR